MLKTVGNYTYDPEHDRIGRGSFAVVYKGRRINGELGEDGSPFVAIKRINKGKLNDKLSENLQMEIQILRKTKHPNIVRLFDIMESKENMYLIMEYCSKGDLSKYIKHHKRVDVDLVKKLMQQIAAALEFLRNKNIIHRDLKPQNLLLSATKEGELMIKLADFGFARYLEMQDMAATLCGSPLYMAPEILSSQEYDAKADLWSVGTIIYECLAGHPPFRAGNYIELLNVINKNSDCLQYPDNTPDDLKDILSGLLKHEPLARFSFEEFFMHPYLDFINYKRPDPNEYECEEMVNITEIENPPNGTAKEEKEQALVSTETPSPLNDISSSRSERRWSLSRGGKTAAQNVQRQGLSIPRISSTSDIGATEEKHMLSDALDDRLSSNSSVVQKYSSFVKSDKEKDKDQSGEKEYVIVDKDFIEVNTFADAIEAFPKAGGSESFIGKDFASAMISHSTSSALLGSTPPFAAGASGGEVDLSTFPKFSDSMFMSPPGATNSSLHLASSSTLQGARGRSSSTSSNIDPVQLVAKLQRIAKRGRAVEQVAETIFNRSTCENSQTTNTLDAYLLYMKAVDLYSKGLGLVKHKVSAHTVSVTPAVNSAVQHLRTKFNDCLETAEKLKGKNPFDSLSSGGRTVEKIIYEHIVSTCKDAAANELLSNYTQSESDYNLALALLEVIVLGVDPRKADHPDLASLRQYMGDILARLKIIKEKQAPTSST
eukprot:Nk52_evm6s156 gene=Nk52_evmTU6s156